MQISSRLMAAHWLICGHLGIICQVENTSSSWTVEDLAATIGQTARSFHRKFVAATGTTPAEAVQRIRTEIARSLLQTTALKVAQIADKTGFGSESALRRALLRQFGASARDLRERF